MFEEGFGPRIKDDEKKNDDKEVCMSRADRAGFVLFFIAIAFLAFLAGAYIAVAKVFPYEHFNNAYKAGEALFKQLSVSDPYTQTDLWREARSDKRGVTIYDPSRTENGYTLYTSGDGTYASLIDMQGHEVHRWSLPFSDVWQKNPSGREAQSDDLMYWRNAQMLPNGDLVAIYVAANDSPWGYGMVKIDRDSNLLWNYRAHTHHDLDITPDGRVIALTHQFTDEPVEAIPQLEMPWLNDYLVALSLEDGKQLSKVSLFESFEASPYRELLYAIPRYATADPLHTNSVEYLDQHDADVFAPAKGHAGQIILSFRHPGVVALVEPASGEMTWATKGPWLGQHDARVLANGNFTLFDNYGNFGTDNRSRVIEVDPETHEIVRRYTGNAEHPLNSGLRGAAQTLANGNRLVTESDGGRLFEVTPGGELVWEFWNPIRGGDKDQYIPVVSSGQRIPIDTLDVDFRNFLASE